MDLMLKEWVEKAEEDYIVALREYRAHGRPAYNAVCFHAQQCMEKYLKAVLVKNHIAFQKIHDLSLLLDKCIALFPLWEAMRAELKRLSGYAVLFRYPGESADRQEAKRAIVVMRNCREQIRASLGLISTKCLGKVSKK